MNSRLVRRISVIAAIGLSGTLAGCASGGDSADGSTVTWWVPNWDRPVAEELVADFEESNPGVNVELVETTADTLANKVSVALDSGSTPDVITELVTRVPQYIAKDQLAPVDSLFDSSMPKEDFLPGSLTPVTSGDATYGVPHRWDNVALIYNKDLFEAAGISEPPATIEEFEATAKKLTSGDVTGTAWPMGNNDNTVLRFFSLAASAPNNPAENVDGSVQLTEESSARAIDIIAGSVRDGWASQSSLEIDNTALRQMFVNGQIAMYVGGVFDIAELQKAGINVGTAVLPGFGEPANSAANGWTYVIPKESTKQDLAEKLVQYLAEPEVMAELTLTFPARVSAAEDPKFHSELVEPFYTQLSEYSVPAPYDPSWGKLIPTVFSQIQSVALGDATAEEAAKAIQDASAAEG